MEDRVKTSGKVVGQRLSMGGRVTRMKEGGHESEEGGRGANSSSVQVRNYNGAIHHERPPIRHADPRVQAVFEYLADVYLYISVNPRNIQRWFFSGDLGTAGARFKKLFRTMRGIFARLVVRAKCKSPSGFLLFISAP